MVCGFQKLEVVFRNCRWFSEMEGGFQNPLMAFRNCRWLSELVGGFQNQKVAFRNSRQQSDLVGTLTQVLTYVLTPGEIFSHIGVFFPKLA